MRILRDPVAGGSGGEPNFLQSLPEDVRAEPSLSTFKDVGSLAKSYVSAQKMIGTKRLSAPDKAWNEGQWNEFYDAVGRPKSFDKYEMPDIKMEEGLSVDDKKREVVLQNFHKMGLTNSQAKGVMEIYMNTLNEGAKGQRAKTEADRIAGESELKQEWGDRFDANLDKAKAVLKKFGDEQFSTYLDQSGLGNNPTLIKMLSKIGDMIMEDTPRGGGSDFNVNNATRAIQEIDTLKLDKDFQGALGNAQHPGHRAAVDKWMSLFKIAYPGKQKGGE